MYSRGLPAATGKELKAWYGGEFIERIKPWQGVLCESMHEGMRVAASWWSLERWYDHQSGACVGIMEPGPE